MSASEILQRLKSMPTDANLDLKGVRDEIVAAYDSAPISDRVALLRIYHIVMDAAEQQVSPADLEALQTTRQQDYSLMLISECVDDTGNVLPEALKVVTHREVAAGRMAPDDELRQLAVGGLEAFKPKEQPQTGWRGAFGWGRRPK